ncbi:ABC transporter ATP-binding protein [Paenibacillus nasutitermitis]|uniref:ABC transporter ATP-binding protein YhcH n=1 Tax=Paenibacillus nasutitermitis TaxID=1652958 RepID=A0A917DX27_9BACL|nr:ABC transporter ATP-binding protein [Paenibacillus nasutitermitis]GGD75961.1 putative ABC transporter ATP-binding protein YhcH [Paenibacillus nasutitermitis]
MVYQSPDEPVVQLKNVTKVIGRRTIIDHLTLDLPQAEVFGFLGPNGSGKTTTIRMMVGLMAMSDGDVIIRGHSIRTDFEKAIRHVGAIVENPEMYKYLSGYQNLLHYSRMVPGITRQRIEEVVELVGLKTRINDKVKTYSLGMRQRLGVAQAIMHKPSLLILDEPTNGLDPAGIRELRDYLRKLTKEEGITVFVSSHLLSEMELMCDRVAIIQAGKLIDVRSIRQGVPLASDLNRVLFEVDRPDEVAELLAEAGAVREQDAVLLNADREGVAQINARLVSAGYNVYGIRILNKSLEEQFLEMTGGESVV